MKVIWVIRNFGKICRDFNIQSFSIGLTHTVGSRGQGIHTDSNTVILLLGIYIFFPSASIYLVDECKYLFHKVSFHSGTSVLLVPLMAVEME